MFAKGRIANRLYRLPEQRALYRKRLGELHDRLWNESALLAQVDQVVKLTPKTSPDAVEKQRSVSDGAITFQQAGTDANAPVVGSVAGRLLQFNCLDEPAAPVAPSARATEAGAAAQ